MKVLVIQQKFIGDVLVSSLFAENLKRAYPAVEIHYIVYRFTMPILENNPFIDRVIPFEEEYRKDKQALFRFLKECKQEHYDVVIDSYAKLESKLISYFTKAKTKISKKGFLQNVLYSHTITLPAIKKITEANAINDKLAHIIPLIQQKDFQYSTSPKVYLTEEEKSNGSHLLEAAGLSKTQYENSYIIGILGSAPEKTWPVDRMISVMKYILEKDPKVSLICNYSPKQQNEIIAFTKAFSTNDRVFLPLIGSSLRDLLSITYHVKGVIANEGGLIHFAKGLGIPTFSIYSPYHQRSDWDTMQEAGIHEAVHLRDFYPELFEKGISKKMRKNPYSLYQKLSTDLVIEKVKVFLQNQ